MFESLLSSILALVVSPAAAAAPGDIPGGPGTTATVSLGGPPVSSDLGSVFDTDWFRAQLAANKLYAFTLRCEDGDFRLSLRDAAGRVLTSASVGCSEPYAGSTQLNLRVPAAGRYFVEVANGDDDTLPPTSYTVNLRADESTGRVDAARGPLGAVARGTLQSDDDQDFFAFRLEQGTAYDFNSSLSGDRDYILLQDRFGNILDGSLEGRLNDFVAIYTGVYYVVPQGYTAFPDYELFVSRSRGAGSNATPLNDSLIGTAGPDAIDALAGNDFVDGLGGDDTLGGGPGDDYVQGGPGNDRVQGAEGNDFLFGDEGEDVLTGNFGVDEMAGGPGNDRFRYWGTQAAGYHSGVGAGRRDRITDFTGGADKIDLRLVDANVTVAGNQDFAFVGNAPFSRPGQVRWRQLGSGTLVQVNTDADPAPEFEIQLTTRVALRASDFVL